MAGRNWSVWFVRSLWQAYVGAAVLVMVGFVLTASASSGIICTTLMLGAYTIISAVDRSVSLEKDGEI